VIRFREVHKAFGPKVVLDGLDLEIPDDGTTVILGYSGSGKSVALKLITGLLEPDAGAVEVDGEVVDDLDRDGLTALREKIGVVFQFAALFDSMTLDGNLRLGLVRRRLDDDEIERRITESLALVDLADARERYPA
jgi:phospholipid/cholesterol/gamma-HCH transport system ATP-binding protein